MTILMKFVALTSFYTSNPLMQIEHSRDLVSLNGQGKQGSACSGIKWRKDTRKRSLFLPFFPFRAQRFHQVEDAQKKAIAEYRKDHPDMGEDTFKVDSPKTTGEAGSSGGAPRQAPPAPAYKRIVPLRAAFERHRPLLVPRRGRIRNPGDPLPQPQPDIPRFDPAAAAQHPRDAQGAPQQRARDITGRFVGRNLRIQPPVPQPKENKVGRAGTDPANRRVDLWRKKVVDPGDGATS